MDKDFLHYAESVELHNLGFDEPCIGFYPSKSSNVVFHYAKDCLTDEYRIHMSNNVLDWVPAPLYQQAFRWFRDNYNLYGCIEFKPHIQRWSFDINDVTLSQKQFEDMQVINRLVAEPPCGSFEEAQLGCLKELISRVKHIKHVEEVHV